MKTKSRLKFESGAQGPLSPLPHACPHCPLTPAGGCSAMPLHQWEWWGGSRSRRFSGQQLMLAANARYLSALRAGRVQLHRTEERRFESAVARFRPPPTSYSPASGEIEREPRRCPDESDFVPKDRPRVVEVAADIHLPDVDLQTAGVSDEDRTRAPRQPPSDDGVGHA